MKPYIISADSTLDMPFALLEKYDIRVIPSYVTLGERTVDDWPDLTQQQLLDYVKSHDMNTDEAYRVLELCPNGRSALLYLTNDLAASASCAELLAAHPSAAYEAYLREIEV